MKYIITEDRLNKLVKRYLNTLNFRQEDSYGSNFVIYLDESSVLKYREEHTGFSILYTEYSFVRSIENFFGMNSEEAVNAILDWVSETYGVTPKTWTWFLKM
jgi:hypothetical protein